MVTESLTIKEESIFAVPLTCNRDDGVVVPIPTFPEGGRVLVWAATVNMVKKQLILSAILVVNTKNSLGIAWNRLEVVFCFHKKNFVVNMSNLQKIN
ncbi:MAG: hypothetical protein M9916_03885 [Crocinitomicaceae bacterium]|nr:hypothetical protein [Crocinitomicaceae bacterium]